jgi:hypothetical protein
MTQQEYRNTSPLFYAYVACAGHDGMGHPRDN